MSATFLTGPEAAKSADRAVGHRKDRDGKIELTPEYPVPEPNPAGSIHTTARDLAKWLQFQVGEGDGTWRGKRIVSEAGLRETQKPQTIIPLEGVAKSMNPRTHFLNYAMGWVVQDYRGVKILSHAGWIDGFRAQLTLIPEKKIGFAILANLHGTRMNLAASNRLIDLLLNFPATDWNAYYGDLMRAEEQTAQRSRADRDKGRNPEMKPTLALAEYAGEYEHPAYGTCKVTLEKGRLRWEWSTFRKELNPYRGDVFEIEDEILRDPLVSFAVQHGRATKLLALDVEFTRKNK
jgi:CubicO group peptidase (beta-lactamase class C family)